jgi:5-methylcytosine-specific restriction endonuclease McrA
VLLDEDDILGCTGWCTPVEVDHIIPKSRGGKATLKNGRTLCFRCNRGKHAKLDHE